VHFEVGEEAERRNLAFRNMGLHFAVVDAGTAAVSSNEI
jgi:hypothetical protein